MAELGSIYLKYHSAATLSILSDGFERSVTITYTKIITNSGLPARSVPDRSKGLERKSGASDKIEFYQLLTTNYMDRFTFSSSPMTTLPTRIFTFPSDTVNTSNVPIVQPSVQLNPDIEKLTKELKSRRTNDSMVREIIVELARKFPTSPIKTDDSVIDIVFGSHNGIDHGARVIVDEDNLWKVCPTISDVTIASNYFRREKIPRDVKILSTSLGLIKSKMNTHFTNASIENTANKMFIDRIARSVPIPSEGKWFKMPAGGKILVTEIVL